MNNLDLQRKIVNEPEFFRGMRFRESLGQLIDLIENTESQEEKDSMIGEVTRAIGEL